MSRRKSRVSKQRHKSANITRAQLHMAWRLHYEGGVSQRELGRKLWARLGYSTPHSCANSLSKMFLSHGWRTRPRVAATVQASTTHGLYGLDGLGTPLSRALINDRQRRRRARRSQQCGATTRTGSRCLRRLSGDGNLCSLHTADGREAMASQLSAMRERKVAA